MIEIFRKNVFINSLLILPYVCLLRTNSFIYPQLYVLQDTDGPLSTVIYNFIGTSALLQSILSAILIFFQAVFINRIVILNRLEKEASLLPGIFYIIFCSTISDFLIFSPLLIGTTFILFSITELFQIYKNNKSDHLIFSSGFWAGIAAIFFLPYLLYIVIIFIGLLILKSVKTNNWFQVITGVCVPFFLLGTIMFWNNSLGQLAWFFQSNSGFFVEIIGHSTQKLIIFFVIGLTIFASVLSYRAIISRKSIQIVKKIDILYWAIFISFFTFILRQPDNLANTQIFAFPICVFLSFLFQKIENKFFAEIFHLIIITAVIIGHFQLAL